LLLGIKGVQTKGVRVKLNLFVDDESTIAEANKTLLIKFGYNVQVFTNGVQALQEFKRHPEQFDLIITDMTMPYMTGLELARQLLQINAKIPIILCTGYNDVINRQTALASGISEYMEKPIVLNELLGRMRTLLDQRGMEKKNSAVHASTVH